MSTVNAPFGLRPVMTTGYASHNGAARWIKADVDTGAIAKGSLVSLAATGDVVACTAAGTTTRDANTPIGVVLGVKYVDATGKPAYSQYLPANAVTAGYTLIKIQVCDDPMAIFEVQSAGSLTYSDVGANVSPATFTVNTTSKLANTTVTSPAVTTTAMFRIVDCVEDAQNTPGDTYTRVRVRFNPGYHAYDIAVGL